MSYYCKGKDHDFNREDWDYDCDKCIKYSEKMDKFFKEYNIQFLANDEDEEYLISIYEFLSNPDKLEDLAKRIRLKAFK